MQLWSERFMYSLAPMILQQTDSTVLLPCDTHTHTHTAACQQVYLCTLQHKYNKASTFVNRKCSRFQHLSIIHINTRDSTFVTGAEQYGRGKPPSHSAVTAQITLSSVHPNLATRGVAAVMRYGMRHFCNHLMCFCCKNKCVFY